MNSPITLASSSYNYSSWRRALAGAAALLCLALGAQAQTQTFTTAGPYTTDLGFTGTGSFYNTSGSAGTGAYGTGSSTSTTTSTATIDFAERVIPFSTTGSKLTFELANPVGNFNSASNVRVFLNIDRAGFVEQLNITSILTSANYGFGAFTSGSGSNGSYTAAYANISTPIIAIAISGIPGNQRPISRVTITLPAAPANYGRRVSARIVLTAAANSVLLVDDVALTTSGGAPLPVELTRFDATAKPQGVALDWATASEKNSDRFEVQRSATGETYQTIGTVKSQGNSTSAHTYSFTDSRPLTGQAYYRLRQVDADGTSAFSPVAAAQALTGLEVSSYPNPSLGSITLPATLGTVQYRLFNTMGQTLLTGKAAGNDRLDITSLPKGPFFLELTGEAGRTTQRLVHQ
jgi:hypothetical protein